MAFIFPDIAGIPVAVEDLDTKKYIEQHSQGLAMMVHIKCDEVQYIGFMVRPDTFYERINSVYYPELFPFQGPILTVKEMTGKLLAMAQRTLWPWMVVLVWGLL